MDMTHTMTSNYMEHGYCLNWEPPLLALHVGSDLVTAISYYSIPFAMFYFAYRRRDIPFFKIFIMFALFILSCGTTHFFSAFTIYRPAYWAEGVVKAITAAVSALTAIVFIPRIPDAIALPSVLNSLDEIRSLNIELAAKNAELKMANFSIENVLDPVNWISSDSRILRANKAACRALGYTPEEMAGLAITDLDPALTAERWSQLWMELKTEGSLAQETRHRTKEGRLLDVEVSANYIAYEGQEFNCVIARDITLRKNSERELVANESRMTSLYRISQLPFETERKFLVQALDEVITLTSSRSGQLYLYNEQSGRFSLQDRAEAMPGEEPSFTQENAGVFGEAVRRRKPVFLNDPLRLEGALPGTECAPCRLLAVPIVVDDAVAAVVGVTDKVEDYTEADALQLKIFMDSVWMIAMRKRAEHDRVQLEKQLLHAQKLESLGVLAGGIAHDFNNILTAIIGNADLALMKLGPGSPVLGHLRDIEKAAARAADLAKQMLAYSGKGKFLVEPVDLNGLLEEMLHMLRVSISKKAVLHFNPASDLPSVEADATQLRQIVMNLVINASEAIGDKSGVIAISTGWMECDRSYLRNVWMDESIQEGTYVYLEISDTGCGMTSEVLAKLFDPFFTTKFTGRGLGMAAVLGIVRGHKGSIRVYSEPGKGTCFKLLFPASERLAEQAAEDGDNNWRGSGTVLLVDDEETVLATGGKLLRELGFEVLTARDGREGLELFKANPGVAFVLLDLTMPHLDGEQCFREMRKINPGVRVIISSGYNEQEVTKRFLGKGLAGFIQKPYRLSDLQRTIVEMEK